MTPNLITLFCMTFAASVGWLTAGAQLADAHPGPAIFKAAFRASWLALRTARYGLHAIDWDEFRRGVRPLVRVLSAALVFATAPAALWELFATGAVGMFGVLLCASMSIAAAVGTPCPWFRYVFRGDRRREQRNFKGVDRRADP